MKRIFSIFFILAFFTHTTWASDLAVQQNCQILPIQHKIISGYFFPIFMFRLENEVISPDQSISSTLYMRLNIMESQAERVLYRDDSELEGSAASGKVLSMGGPVSLSHTLQEFYYSMAFLW